MYCKNTTCIYQHPGICQNCTYMYLSSIPLNNCRKVNTFIYVRSDFTIYLLMEFKNSIDYFSNRFDLTKTYKILCFYINML